DEDDEGGSVSIGWVVHYFLSLKARLIRPLAAFFAQPFALLSSRAATAPSMRAEPRFAAGTGTTPLPDEDPEPDEGDGDESSPKVSRAARKPSRPASKAGRKSADGYELPPLNLLAAPKSSDRFAPSTEAIQETAVSLEHVLGDFGVRGEIINARPGPV